MVHTFPKVHPLKAVVRWFGRRFEQIVTREHETMLEEARSASWEVKESVEKACGFRALREKNKEQVEKNNIETTFDVDVKSIVYLVAAFPIHTGS